ncbi:MAG TPA: multicopper oxidase domain-containing protein [Pseudobdellovibrionaceae bacterium]|jgi:FtsP/CotA-like multicopper oxidase with cupredoxin domain
MEQSLIKKIFLYFNLEKMSLAFLVVFSQLILNSTTVLAVAPPPLPGVKPGVGRGGGSAPGLPPGSPPGLPGQQCTPAGNMPVSPDMCQMMPNMCGCERFPSDPKITPNRRRLDPSLRKAFPKVAPGIEHFSQLGYCTGVSSGDTYTASSNGKVSTQGGVRKYTLRLKQAVEPKTGRTYLKTTMDDQADDNDRMKRCSAPSQVEPGVSAKTRPTNAPTLFFVEGETAEITVINESDPAKDNSTSIHWHGIILPNDQDGIVDITQAPIPPGGRKVYRFTLQHNGTYWYHPHDLNEQDTKGAFIIFPNPAREARLNQEFGGVGVKYHQDRVIFLSDYKIRKTMKIFNYLRDEDRNAYELDSGIHRGWLSQLKCGNEYIENFKMMKMFWMDKADVWYNSFFMNDETCLNCGSKTSKIQNLHTEYPGQTFPRLNEFSNIQAGERVRLRLINGSASSYFFLDYANTSTLAPNQKLDFLVVAKDGLPVKPFYIDQLYMGMGETYDVLVEVPDDGTLYELRAKSIDDIPDKRSVRTLIGHNPLNQGETSSVVPARNVPVQVCGPYDDEEDQTSQISYSQLLAPDSRVNGRPADLRPFEVYHSEKPIARYNLSLSGSMEDYHWKISGENGTKLRTDPMHMLYMTIKEGYRIRVTIENDMVMGMMNHPWHLHGNWFRLIKEGESDADIAKKALLHTATIFPGQKVTLEFYADPAYRGAWMFHCHNLYHMANDMMMYLKYDTVTDEHMSHMTGHHHEKSMLPGALAGIKNQYVVGGVGSWVGTNGYGPSAQFRYRGTLGDNKGWVDLKVDLAGNMSSKNKGLELNSRLRHCFEVNKCVFLDFRLHRSDGSTETSEYIGGQYKPWNSDLMVVEAGAGSICTSDEETKGVRCSPAIKANVSSTIDAGWNTKVTGKVGCEGKYCSEFFASIQAATTFTPRLTISATCTGSTNAENTGCGLEAKLITDPIALGKQH